MASNDTIFSKLKEEHEILKDLLEQAAECPPGERKKMLTRIEEELIPHARGEEKTLYAVMRLRSEEENNEEILAQANEAYAEHKVADQLIAELKKIDVKDEKWLGLFSVIKENLEHHIEEEEEDLFAQARELLGEVELQEILMAYIKSKEMFEESLPTQGQINERTPDQDLQSL